ncbi:MAG: Riboflavin synthase eubacterial/eukaryotic, partial [uncultured Solirubrobacteraceae bacterium]
MFTGLVEDLGTVAALDATPDGVRLTVHTRLAGELGPGDSIAVNGVCLTAVDIAPDAFTADVMQETLRRSSLGEAAPGRPV